MCGIGGILCKKGTIDIKKILKIFQYSMSHRGPDAKGYFIDSSRDIEVGLAHTRLSIIDLSPDANQPISNEDESIYLVCNGEIYNYRELRKKLEKKHQFKSRSDSEVILHLYEEKGKDLLKDLRGMFSFAIWDSEKNKLFLARDRYGIKPLYYSLKKDIFIFASEIRALIKTNIVKKEINPESIHLFLLLGYIPAPNTIYKNIFGLEPGYFMIVDNSGIKKQRYYNLRNIFNNDWQNVSWEEATKKVEAILRESIKSHLISDVPISVFLSGGLDSSSLVAFAAESQQNPITTISVTFPDTPYDESEYARKVANKFDTQHIEVEVSSSDVERHIDKIFYYMDQPTVNGINTYFVSWAAAKKGVKVALSGIGGDELFYGYPSFNDIPKLFIIAKLFSVIPFKNKIIKPIINNLFYSKAKIYNLLQSNTISEIYFWYRGLFMESEIKKLLLDGPFATSWNFYPPSITFKDPYSEISFLEITNYMANQLLRDTDVFSMAHSLEVRVPFLDHKLVEMIAKLPSKYKMGKPPKKLLVSMVKNKLPKEIINREKRGFTFPFELWLKNELRDFMEEKLRGSQYYNKKFIDNLLKGFFNGKVHWSRVWACVVLERWLSEIQNRGGDK